MVAVKSAIVAPGLASVNEATWPLKTGGANTGTGKRAGLGGVDRRLGRRGDSAASAMTAEPLKMVTAPPSSVTVTV